MERTTKELLSELMGMTITRDRLKRDKRRSRALDAEIRDIKKEINRRKSQEQPVELTVTDLIEAHDAVAEANAFLKP